VQAAAATGMCGLLSYPWGNMSAWAFVLGDYVLGDFVLGEYVLHSFVTSIFSYVLTNFLTIALIA